MNLLFWIPFLVAAALLSALPLARLQGLSYSCVDTCYRAAEAINHWWLRRVLGITINVVGDIPRDPRAPLLVISNHRSWFDILALQSVIVPGGPILKFLIKRELVYVPVVGWICLALRFPRLSRGQRPGGREKDLDSVSNAVVDLGSAPGALINFAEGTRFTPGKCARSGSPYRYLLKPKTGGLRIMLKNLPDAHVIDATLVYPADMNFWQCLSGALQRLDVHLNHFEASDIDDINQWLNARWEEKEALYSAIRQRYSNNQHG